MCMIDDGVHLNQFVHMQCPLYSANFMTFLPVYFLLTGEIEPCKLEVKKQAPIRRFAAMKELVGECTNANMSY